MIINQINEAMAESDIQSGEITSYGLTMYSNSPSYVNLLASSFSVQLKSGAKEKRRFGVGVDNNDQFSYASPLGIDISVDFYIDYFNRDSFEKVINSAGKDYIYLKIGRNEYKVYLNSLSIAADPFVLVKATANFSSYETRGNNEGILTGSNITISNLVTEALCFGDTCSLIGETQFFIDNPKSVNYSIECSRTPNYILGSPNPNNVFLNSVIKKLSFKSDQLSNFINAEGELLTTVMALVFKDHKGRKISQLSVRPSSKILNQSYAVDDGGLLNTEFLVTEVVL
jgi:hypothetical protein